MIGILKTVLGAAGGFVKDKSALARDKLAAAASDWKDELALITIIIPFLMGFFWPDTVAKGWDTHAKAPEWYQDLFFWGLAAALGIERIIKPWRKKR